MYWTNIPQSQGPEDKGIILKDILETENLEYLKVSKKWNMKKYQDKASCLTGGGHSGGNHSDMDILVFEKPHGFNSGGITLRSKFNTLRDATSCNYAIKD